MADTLQALRESEFHRSTTLALDAHPFVSDAESGNLSAKRLTALALEQLSVVACDLKSFRHLAGTCQADGSKPAATKFFSMLADGEEAASGKLSCMLSWLGVTPKEQAAYTWQMEAQARARPLPPLLPLPARGACWRAARFAVAPGAFTRRVFGGPRRAALVK